MTTDAPTLPAPAPKPRQIPKRVREAIDLLARRKMTVTAAAQKVGLSREYLSRSIGEPHVAEYLRRKAGRIVAVGAVRAATREIELIDSPSEHVSHDASKHVLAIAGIKPSNDTQVSVNAHVNIGWIIDLRRDDRPPRPGDVIVAAPGVSPTAESIAGGAAPIIDVDPVEHRAPLVDSRRGQG